jgi:PEP-CTERM motif
MPGFRRLPVSLCTGLTVSLFLFTARCAHADLPVSNIGLYDGSSAPTVYITYTGSTAPVDVYADPQTATNANWQSNGSPIPLYCTDTVHDNYLGSSYSVNVESSPYFSTTPANRLTVAQAANLVAWALENAGNTIDGRAATQLFIWSVLDKNFSVTNWNGNTSLESTYSTLGSDAGSAYNPGVNYLPGAVFLGAVHDGNLYQDLAYAPPGLSITSIAPEPSTFLIAGLGAVGMIAYGWRRRPAVCR